MTSFPLNFEKKDSSFSTLIGMQALLNEHALGQIALQILSPVGGSLEISIKMPRMEIMFPGGTLLLLLLFFFSFISVRNPAVL